MLKISPSENHKIILESERMQKEHSDWREGQCYFNALYKHFPEVANDIRGTEKDPYYWDDRYKIMTLMIELTDWNKV